MNETLVNQAPNNSNPDNQSLAKPNRLNGILIVLVITLPMIVAYLMYHTGWGIPTGTSNKGILLQPQPLAELALQNNDSSLADLYPAETKKWRLLVPVSADCQETCQQNLYLTRQVHIRLAEKAYRVERILLLLAPASAETTETLAQDHPGVRIVESNLENLRAWLNSVSEPEDYYYLIDQGGYAMMRYGNEHSGQNLLDDLKKVLKYTYEK